MRARAAELVVKKCLGHRDGEAVTIVTDTSMEPVAREFQRALVEIGIETTLVSMPPRRDHGEEPTRGVAEALKASPVAVLLTSKSVMHTVARREATDKHLVRIASIPSADPNRLEGLLDIDYTELQKRGEALAGCLRGAHEVHLTSPAGTDLTFEITGRPVYCDAGRLTAPGAFGSLPAGEVCVAPLEGTAKGIVVVDGSVDGFGTLMTPITIRFDHGVAVEISDPQLRDLLQQHGHLAFNLAEFGIGINPHAEIVGNIAEDEKALGTAYVALGGNANMGGAVQVPIHIDAVLRGAGIELDGQKLPEELLTRPPGEKRPAPRPLPVDIAKGDTYRMLFDNSNDAQYVLDLETQIFLEVNSSFERLTGYTREELREGGVTAPKIVARESMTTYIQKRETRRITPSDRYDMKLLCRNGEKKPVEISVKRVQIQGRDIIIGALRDLSARKKLEQEMWEKIEELGYSNSRIFALTEKIRRVPELTPQLLHLTDEVELFERASQLLCSRDGLAYAEVSFYLLKDDALELSHSTAKTKKRKMKLSEDHKLVRVLRGDDPGVVTKSDAVLPLKGRERNIGVFEVSFHPKEIEVLEGNERALKGYQDLLMTLSNMLGLLVENLHLYETVRHQSIVDQLTGVFNRRYFDKKLADEINRAQRYGRDLSLLMVDLDKFKAVNDTMGHKQGDSVLVEAAQMFGRHTRDVDTVCRYGGDEFAILMPETPYDGALVKAEALRREARDHRFANTLETGKPIHLTLSIGVTAFRAEVKSGDDLLRIADEALYKAKRSGRDMVCGSIQKPGAGSKKPVESKGP